MKKLLVTSIGNKSALLAHLLDAIERVSSPITILTSDASSEVLCSKLAPSFVKSPLFQPTFRAEVAEFIARAGVNFILPTREQDQLLLQQMSNSGEIPGIAVLASPLQTLKLFGDKMHSEVFLRNLGFPTIPTFTDLDSVLSTQLVVKERFGAGSIGTRVEVSRAEAAEHAPLLENPVFQPYIRGPEFTVDAYYSSQGDLKGLSVRSRDLVIRGESYVTTVTTDKDLNEFAIRVATRLSETTRIFGPICFQFIVAENGPMIIEVNPRFGGASGASILAGLDSLSWLLGEASGEQTFPDEIFLPGASLTVTKVTTDTVLELGVIGAE